jgi:hypothetical protein
MPNTDVEIKVEYFTDEELFTAGVPLRQTGDGEWVLDAMPNFDVELEVVYFTDEELFTAGVPLRQTGEGEWVLDAMPNFDVELEVVYFTDEELFTDGVLLRQTGDGEWILDAMPNFDVELEICYADGLYVEGYGNSTTSDKWVFIASPVSGSVMPTAVEDLIADTASQYDLYRFNQSAEKEWQNYKAHTEGFVLENGKGYLYARKNNEFLVFSGEMNTRNDTVVALAYDENAHLAGWNLVGNPFPEAAYIDKPFYQMNDDGTGIEPVENYNNYSASVIPTYTGVLVQATGTGQSVTFTKTMVQNAVPHQGGLQITVAEANTRGTVVLDKAIVSFNPGSQLGKFRFGKQNANIYIPQGHEEYAIAYSNKSGEVPLNFKAYRNGDYSMTIHPDGVKIGYLHLIDNLTGDDVDLLIKPSYTFKGDVSDYPSRFRLVFGSDHISDDSDGSFAFFSDGRIILGEDGVIQVIDMMGRVVVCKDSVRAISTEDFAPGVYVLRLIDGEKAKTQKIVIR